MGCLLFVAQQRRCFELASNHPNTHHDMSAGASVNNVKKDMNERNSMADMNAH